MVDAAALITAIAALVGALAWSAALLVLLIVFRRPLRRALHDMPGVIGRMQKVKLGAFEAELSEGRRPYRRSRR